MVREKSRTYRAKMNIVFRLPSEDLEKRFAAEALADFMASFAKANG